MEMASAFKHVLDDIAVVRKFEYNSVWGRDEAERLIVPGKRQLLIADIDPYIGIEKSIEWIGRMRQLNPRLACLRYSRYRVSDEKFEFEINAKSNGALLQVRHAVSAFLSGELSRKNHA